MNARQHAAVKEGSKFTGNAPHPILADATIDGVKCKLVVQLTKQAFAYVFRSRDRKRNLPIVERPVPQTDIKGSQKEVLTNTDFVRIERARSE
jgi:glucose dehydrogenase